MEQIIGIKQLHTQLRKISQETLKGRSFIVVKNSRPVFRIEPISDSKEKKYNFSDLKGLQFQCSDKNLSKKIDKIMYAR